MPLEIGANEPPTELELSVKRRKTTQPSAAEQCCVTSQAIRETMAVKSKRRKRRPIGQQRPKRKDLPQSKALNDQERHAKEAKVGEMFAGEPGNDGVQLPQQEMSVRNTILSLDKIDDEPPQEETPVRNAREARRPLEEIEFGNEHEPPKKETPVRNARGARRPLEEIEFGNEHIVNAILESDQTRPSPEIAFDSFFTIEEAREKRDPVVQKGDDRRALLHRLSHFFKRAWQRETGSCP